MKTNIIQVPIFHHTLQVLFGDYLEVKGALNSEFDVDDKLSDAMLAQIGKCIGFMWYCSDIDEYFLWVNTVPATIRDYGTLVHEIQHFVYLFLRNKGLSHCDESDELYSYLFEYIFVEIDCWISKLNEDAESDKTKE